MAAVLAHCTLAANRGPLLKKCFATKTRLFPSSANIGTVYALFRGFTQNQEIPLATLHRNNPVVVFIKKERGLLLFIKIEQNGVLFTIGCNIRTLRFDSTLEPILVQDPDFSLEYDCI